MGWRIAGDLYGTGLEHPFAHPVQSKNPELTSFYATEMNNQTSVNVSNKIEKKPTIEISNLDFFYGSFQGLKNINLKIQEKKVTAFIGPSGCGKSTLLRTLNRMYDLYPGQRAEGKIMYHGRNILEPGQDVNMLRAKIGMVFQKPTPFPMSVYDNIAFGVRLYEKLPKGEMDERVEWALNKAALWGEVKDKLHKDRKSVV